MGDRLTTYTSASVVILRDCYRSLEGIRTNLALLSATDWMEQELLERAHDQLNSLMHTVGGLEVHRNKGAKAQ